jgi:flavin-binding protein dodecin
MQQRSGFDEVSPHEIKKRLEIRVTAEIDQIGISPKALGRSYLIDAIMHRTEGQSGQVSAIAKIYGKTEASVERAMQNAINKAWSTMQPDDLLLHYTARIQSEKGVPTVTEFVCHYANKMKTEY